MSSCEALMKKGGELSDAFAVRCGESETVAMAAGVTTCATAVAGGTKGAAATAGCAATMSCGATNAPSSQHGIARCIVFTFAVMQHATAHGGTMLAPRMTTAASASSALRIAVPARFC